MGAPIKRLSPPLTLAIKSLDRLIGLVLEILAREVAIDLALVHKRAGQRAFGAGIEVTAFESRLVRAVHHSLGAGLEAMGQTK